MLYALVAALAAFPFLIATMKKMRRESIMRDARQQFPSEFEMLAYERMAILWMIENIDFESAILPPPLLPIVLESDKPFGAIHFIHAKRVDRLKEMMHTYVQMVHAYQKDVLYLRGTKNLSSSEYNSYFHDFDINRYQAVVPELPPRFL